MDKNKKESKNEEEIIIEEDVEATSSFGSDIQKLREKLKICTTEKQEYLDGWQRAKADLINSKRDFEEQRKDFVRFAKGDLIVQIIPVLDSFDMAMSNTSGVPAAWLNGVKHIHNQFISILKENGVEKIEPKAGDSFDINKHISVELVKVENENESGKIISGIQNGYELNGKRVREAKVRVGEL